MAWVLLFVWIAWASQSDPNAMVGPSPRSGNIANHTHSQQNSGQEGSGIFPDQRQEPTGRIPVEEGSTHVGPQDPERVVPLRELPEPLDRVVRYRVLANINTALRADGQQPLDEAELEISVKSAEEMLRRYKAIWASTDVYDDMMDERVDSLLATGGPGTSVLDVTGWKSVTEAAFRNELSRRLGKDIKEIMGNDHTIVRWRREGKHHVRYGVFAPGTDKTLDSIWAAFDEHFNTTVRRWLIELADLFKKE